MKGKTQTMNGTNPVLSMKVGTGTVPPIADLEEAKKGGLLTKRQFEYLKGHSGKNMHKDNTIDPEEIVAIIRSVKAKRIKEKEKKIEREVREVDREKRMQLLSEVKESVLRWWPKYWPATELVLSTCHVLGVKTVRTGLGLMLSGASGAGKSTIIEHFFKDSIKRNDLIIVRDKFTPAAILSGYGDTSKKDLEKRALFRQVKHRILLTSDMGYTLKSGTESERRENMGLIAQWLDGQGVIAQFGTHEALGEKGDFRFVWVGGTIPPDKKTWEVMATLGTRLMFYDMPTLNERDLQTGSKYNEALEDISFKIGKYMQTAFPPSQERYNMVDWPLKTHEITSAIHRISSVVAGSLTFNSGGEVTRPTKNHFSYRLDLLAAGRASMYDRNEVKREDVDALLPIILASGPKDQGRLLYELMHGPVTLDEIQKRNGMTPGQSQVVGSRLNQLTKLGVVERMSNKYRFVPEDEYKDHGGDLAFGANAPDLFDASILNPKK
jgi:hypothetical protein